MDMFNSDIWSNVAGYPNYMVNRDGDIVYLSDNGVEKVSKYMDDLGYECVDLKGDNDSYISRDVCRIVAEAFVENPDEYAYDDIRHIDGDLRNNKASNLEYVDLHENPDDRIRHELYSIEPYHQRASYRMPIASKNLESGEERHFGSIAEAEESLGLTGIRHVLKGRRESCGGYIFWYDT